MNRIVADLSDATLMIEMQNGGHAALGELFDRYSSRAYRTAFSVCHDRDCAQDAVQDAFVSMWLSKATYDPDRGAVAPWALSIVRHRAMYLAHKRALALKLTDIHTMLNEQPADVDVPSAVEDRASRVHLMVLLAQLPPAQQEVIRLGFFDGFSHGEIARRLSLPPGTVKGRMRLGLTKLRSELDSEASR
jgi:RNA polymerase sigma-70 factor (ECF subfamily)